MSGAEEIYLTGTHTVRLALSRRKQVRELLLTRTADRRHTDLRDLAEGRCVPVKILDRREFTRLIPAAQQGVALLCCRLQMDLDEGDLEGLIRSLTSPLLLILDGVEDPRNLGACIRAAAAFGAHAVVLPRKRSAPLSAVASKVASGAEELTPLIRVANLARTLDYLKQFGIWLHALVPDASQEPITSVDLSSGAALVLGSEGRGIRKLTISKCDHLAYIPMIAESGSLNIAVAAGIALYEATRQRQVDLAG